MPRLPVSGRSTTAPNRRLAGGRLARIALAGLLLLPVALADGIRPATSVTSVSVPVTADAQVRSRYPSRNYGSAVRLRTRRSTHDTNRFYLRFTLPPLPGPVTSVSLRLFVRDGSANGGAVLGVTGPWNERTITWRNAPGVGRQVLARIGPTAAAGSWERVALPVSLAAKGTVELAVVGTGGDGAIFTSRETGRGPRLVIGVGSAAKAATAPRKTAPPASPTPAATTQPDPAAQPTPAPTDPPAATATPIADPSPTATPAATAAATPPTPTPAPTPTVSPVRTATPAPATATPAPVVRAPAVGILVGRTELADLPMSGSAWTNLKSWADASAGTPDVKDQDEANDLHVLAKALVYARTGVASYRSDVLANLRAVVGTEVGGRTLAAARNVPGYVIAADLIDLAAYDPTFDDGTFRPWLKRLLTEDLSGLTLRSTHELRPNNWGTHAGAARAAIARYLGDATELARTAQVFRGWLGDRSAYAGFSYGDLSWQCDPAHPVGIDPKGCVKAGIAVDGALPDDMRRGGTLQWPPVFTDYAWEAMQGATLQALILDRAGYPAFDWSDAALERATRFLYERAGWLPTGDDQWQPWLLNHAYRASWAETTPARPGKNVGFTDWLFGR